MKTILSLVGCLAAGGVCADDRPQYELTVLRGLGGTSSLGASINDRGWIAGRSNESGNQTRHATLWRGGVLTDLETLGGPNSAVLWPVKNVRGVVSGITQTDEVDPRRETWSCGFFFPLATRVGYRCVGFRWQNGVMTRLPALRDGFHGFATGTNNQIRTVGWTEDGFVDDTCVAPQIYRFRAVIWGPDGKIERELLPAHADDTSTAATAINDRGQVVGISGICDQAVGRFSAIRMVLWEKKQMTVIPAFGGVAWNTPMAINERGDVVGFANASEADGGNTNFRAFHWRKGQPTRPLPGLAGHVTSQATGVNDRRQIVGQSCSPDGACRAVLWEGCDVEDLNKLVDDDSVVLTVANDIDDRGRITGQGQDVATGEFVAFVATPRDR
jgi:probable HAF family extracellular repeat protein